MLFLSSYAVPAMKLNTQNVPKRLLQHMTSCQKGTNASSQLFVKTTWGSSYTSREAPQLWEWPVRHSPPLEMTLYLFYPKRVMRFIASDQIYSTSVNSVTAVYLNQQYLKWWLVVHKTSRHLLPSSAISDQIVVEVLAWQAELQKSPPIHPEPLFSVSCIASGLPNLLLYI